MCPVTRFFRCGEFLDGTFSQKGVTSYTFFRSAYLKFLRLRKVSTKMCAQLHIFSLWRLEFLMGLGKIFTKKCAQMFLRCEDLVFDGKSLTKKCDQLHIFSQCSYLEFWMGLEKNLTKRCDQLHVFAVQTILSFWMGLRKVSTKMCAQLHIFSLWRLTWVFDGTWKNFHKKVCPVTYFFAVETILSFWWDL